MGTLYDSVLSTGTPADNQVAVWTATSNTLEGDANFTWTGTTLAIAGAGAQLLLPLENDDATPTLAFGDGDTGFYEVSDDTIGVSVAGTQRYAYNSTAYASVTSGGFYLDQTATSATNPAHSFQSDTDTGIGSAAADQLSLISGGVEILRLVETGVATTDQVIIGPAGIIGTFGTPALAFGDGDTGFYESADDTLITTIGGTSRWQATGTLYGSNTSTGGVLQTAASAILPGHTFANDLNTGIGTNAADELSLIAGGIEAKRLLTATLQTTAVTTTEIIAIPVASGEGFGFRINIIGTEDATGDTVFESIFGAIRNQAGTTAIVGSSITDRTDDAGASTWVITVAADDTTDELTVDVAGEAAHTIDWKVSVELLNV